jgi:hypothetical protein
MRRLTWLLLVLMTIPFVSANTYTLRKAYSGRVVDGQNEIIFVNTTITLARGDTIKFQFSPTDKGYLYALDSFSGKDAVFLTPSKELVTISEGTSKDFDSDGDGMPDLNIYAWRVYTTGVTVYATPIREVEASAEKPLQEEKPVEPAPEVTENVNNYAPETAPQENVTVQNPQEQNDSALTVEKNSALPIVLILLLTAVLLVVIFLLARKKRRPF